MEWALERMGKYTGAMDQNYGHAEGYGMQACMYC
jgi:hypothetical protein